MHTILKQIRNTAFSYNRGAAPRRNGYPTWYRQICRYVVHKLDAASQEPFVLVWLHTGATYLANCPSAWWLWSTYEG